MDDLVDPEPLAWHVLFMEWPERSWWDIVNRPGFQHVVLLGWSPARELWTTIEPRRCRLETKTWTADECSALLWAWRGRVTAALVMRRQDGDPNRTLFLPRLPPMSCVTVAAYVLGVEVGASTPYGLYRDLQKLGALPSSIAGAFQNGKSAGQSGLSPRRASES